MQRRKQASSCNLVYSLHRWFWQESEDTLICHIVFGFENEFLCYSAIHRNRDSLYDYIFDYGNRLYVFSLIVWICVRLANRSRKEYTCKTEEKAIFSNIIVAFEASVCANICLLSARGLIIWNFLKKCISVCLKIWNSILPFNQLKYWVFKVQYTLWVWGTLVSNLIENESENSSDSFFL